jgi:selenocysteine-specific elongation factor
MWGVEVLDCEPAPLGRRGAAKARAAELAGWRGTADDQVRSRGLVPRSLLELFGVSDQRLDAGVVEADGWLLSAQRAEQAAGALQRLVTSAGDHGLPVEAVARELALPAALVPALVRAPLRLAGGRVRPERVAELPRHLREAADRLRADLGTAPFAAPDAGRLRELGLDERAVTLLHRRGELLHVGSSVVLLPEAPEEAVQRLSQLQQPFTTSQARQALGTSRRVVLPLLAHLDRTRRTVRLADDRRRVRG